MIRARTVQLPTLPPPLLLPLPLLWLPADVYNLQLLLLVLVPLLLVLLVLSVFKKTRHVEITQVIRVDSRRLVSRIL